MDTLRVRRRLPCTMNYREDAPWVPCSSSLELKFSCLRAQVSKTDAWADCWVDPHARVSCRRAFPCQLWSVRTRVLGVDKPVQGCRDGVEEEQRNIRHRVRFWIGTVSIRENWRTYGIDRWQCPHHLYEKLLLLVCCAAIAHAVRCGEV